MEQFTPRLYRGTLLYFRYHFGVYRVSDQTTYTDRILNNTKLALGLFESSKMEMKWGKNEFYFRLSFKSYHRLFLMHLQSSSLTLNVYFEQNKRLMKNLPILRQLYTFSLHADINFIF